MTKRGRNSWRPCVRLLRPNSRGKSYRPPTTLRSGRQPRRCGTRPRCWLTSHPRRRANSVGPKREETNPAPTAVLPPGPDAGRDASLGRAAGDPGGSVPGLHRHRTAGFAQPTDGRRSRAVRRVVRAEPPPFGPARLAATHRDGPYFLNVQRYLDMPQALAMAAENSQVVIHQPDTAGWDYPTAVVQRLGWDAQRLQFRQPD